MKHGIYVWMTKYPIFLFRKKWAIITVYCPEGKEANKKDIRLDKDNKQQRPNNRNIYLKMHFENRGIINVRLDLLTEQKMFSLPHWACLYFRTNYQLCDQKNK